MCLHVVCVSETVCVCNQLCVRVCVLFCATCCLCVFVHASVYVYMVCVVFDILTTIDT